MSAGFSNEGGAPAAIFATTRWSVVLQAGVDAGGATQRALEQLCSAYWYPIYAYVRRLGQSPHDAQDLTQSFFAYLLEKRLLAKAQPESGRFRSFLLGSLKNFMANEWRRQNALKRGAGQTISIDPQDAEDRYAVEQAEAANPQMLYDRAWAVAVLDGAIGLVEAEYADAGKKVLFETLLPSLQGDRLRGRYREMLRAAVANTVADPLEVDGELRYLMQVLSRP